MQRIVEGPFAFLFPSKLQPAEVARKLERAMEDSILLQGEATHRVYLEKRLAGLPGTYRTPATLHAESNARITFACQQRVASWHGSHRNTDARPPARGG